MTGNNLLIRAAKLELGDTQTLGKQEDGQWVLNDPPPDKALELLKCQRWYIYHLQYTTSGMSFSNSTCFSMFIYTPTQMRMNPIPKLEGYNARVYTGYTKEPLI